MIYQGQGLFSVEYDDNRDISSGTKYGTKPEIISKFYKEQEKLPQNALNVWSVNTHRATRSIRERGTRNKSF